MVMKLSRFILLFMVITVCTALFSCASSPAPDSGTENADYTDCEYAIVISADASDTEVYAAQALQEYLSALDGAEYPIIDDDQPFDGFKFCIGATAVYDISDITDKAADSYVITPFDGGLAIYGSGSRGTVYGVYTFLENFCGYRVYTPESGMVSITGKMTLPGEKIEYNTYFEYRNTDWRSGWVPLYSLANKLNGEFHGAVTREQGGYIPYLGASSHTLSTVFCAADKYFGSHPDYFALYEGERNASQLCLTNENVYEIVLEEVLDLLKNSHDPEADLQIISLSQADNPVYCECEACKALDSESGSQSGTLITFVNRIARAVKEEGYDNVAFDTLAYMHTRKAPSAVVPEDNVIVRLCTFECCFSHPMDDAGCPENAKLMKDLEEWSAICDRMYIWDYTTNYACTLGIFPDFHVLQKNLQCFYEHGIRGVYEEGNYFVHLCDTEFGDLRTYLIAKLLEDPYCDYDAQMLDFCSYYYGEGGEYIKSAIDEITACTKDHVTIYSSMAETFAVDDKKAEEIDQLWDAAEKAAKSPETLAAILRSKLSWRYVKAALGLREFRGTLEENKDEREALYNDLIAHGVEMINEWTGIEEDFAEYEQIPVEEWEYAGRYYYLQYDLCGGTDGPPNQWCNEGASWIPETIPKRKGYLFLGWAAEKDAAAAEYLPGSFIYPSSDMVLYAVWQEAPEGEDSEVQQGVPVPFGTYDLYITGAKVDSQNADRLQDLDSVTLREGGFIRYEDSDRTLYLKDVDITASEDPESGGAAVGYNSRDNTALTISVEGTCHLESRDCGQDSLMVLGSWGNLCIDLMQGAVLEIEASPCRDQYTNNGIYMDAGRNLTVSGPGTLRISGGDARPDEGAGIALYAQGDITFEKDCSVNIISDTASAVSTGCRLEGGDITFKDGSQIRIEGGEPGISYGLDFIKDETCNFNADNWTGSMTVSGSAGALRCVSGTDAGLRKDPKQISLTGYTGSGEQNPVLLDSETYKCKALQKYTKLLFEGRGEAVR